ncbi:MAG TPA: DnaJ C-terminal domain-containing protein [Candidatus Limnocylindrales bacterium]|nr:DnaJ C-terminal domain-containing protein [Candidatus Limnocylindrales bacterium]
MVDVRDYYQTLGVPRTASAADIKKAFRKLAREHHPDKKPGDKIAEQRFKDINEANAVLSDPDKRTKYDRFGKDWEAYARAGAAAGRAGGASGRAGDPFGPGGPFEGYTTFGGTGGGNVRYEFHTTGEGAAGGQGQFSDFFRMMFGEEAGGHGGSAGGGRIFRTAGTGSATSIDDLLAGMGVDAAARGGGRAGRSGGAGGGSRAVFQPVEATAEISLEEAFHGTSRIVEVGGRRLEVTLPRGVDTGSRVRLSGKGPDGRDLIVVIRVHPHGVFTRRGADLEREVPVTLREALLGGEVPVGTLKGRVLLTLPPGTQNGKSFRLAGQGMPRLKGGDAGDLYVRIRVVLPTHLTDEAKSAAEGFLDLAHQPDPRA